MSISRVPDNGLPLLLLNFISHEQRLRGAVRVTAATLSRVARLDVPFNNRVRQLAAADLVS